MKTSRQKPAPKPRFEPINWTYVFVTIVVQVGETLRWFWPHH